MEVSNIITRLSQQLNTKKANSLYVNGAPGTGKSTLLERISVECTEKFPRAKVLGPYTEVSINPISRQLVEDLHDLGYLSETPDQHVMDDLNSTWHWLERTLDISIKQSFIILVDLDSISWNDYNSLRVLFSSLRYLEHFWESKKAQFAFVLAGFWDDAGLDEHYNHIDMSFPYTTGSNYLIWDGIECDDFISSYIDPLFFQKNGFFEVLHEIAGGNPMIMRELALIIDPKDITIYHLMEAAKSAAQDSQYSKKIQECFKDISGESIEILKKLLSLRQIPVRSLSPSMERLRLLGIVKEKVSRDSRYIILRSWFVELMLRSFPTEMNFSISIYQGSELTDLMPTITHLNQKAFELLQEIEILMRNYIVSHLWKHRAEKEPLLCGWYQDAVFRRDGNIINRNERVAQDLADEWRERCRENGLAVVLNPDIAYITLPGLAGMLEQLSIREESLKLDQVIEAVEEVVDIRDAVMHNQLIEFDDFEKILVLQNRISTAINEEY